MTPRVSVVMGVYNGAESVRTSVESVLAQAADVEVIVVDDGSRDATGEVLAGLAAADPRVRALRQENAGLTRALIRGCAEARGEYIARIDCGDRYLPGKIEKQLRLAAGHPQASIISCATRFVGPGEETLYESVAPAEGATERLRTLDPDQVRGPSSHGSALFPRALYEKVGGYRPQFYFAQDLDLWTRLIEIGTHVPTEEVLYEVAFGPGSISGLHRERQLECARAILDAARLRRAGQNEAPALAVASTIRPGAKSAPPNPAGAYYFIGSCLRQRGDPRAQQYFFKALRAKPLHLMAALRVLQGVAG